MEGQARVAQVGPMTREMMGVDETLLHEDSGQTVAAKSANVKINIRDNHQCILWHINACTLKS
jgi:hypothetical protein